MGFGHSSRKLWILVLWFYIQNTTLSLSAPECSTCYDCWQHEPDYCYCIRREGYNNYGGYNYLLCRNVEENSLISDISRSQTRMIVFQNSNIKHLTMNLLTDLLNVNEMFLNGTKIEEIQVGAFSSLTKIEELYLHENELTRVTRGCFNSLYHLRILDLHSNRINSIEEESFHGLNSLANLNLGNNKLENLSKTLLSYLYKLETFNVSKNALKTIDFQFSVPTHIEIPADGDYDFPSSQIAVLDLSYNEINELPEKVFEYMKNLEILNISRNDISDLKISMFSNLKKLNTLNMNSLKLKNLEIQDFVLLSHLNVLNIQSNNLKFFDDDILDFCPDLKSLAIDGNQFSCSVVASMIMNSKRRKINIAYTKSYQNENIDGIQCTRNIEKASDLSKDVTNMLREEIKAAFREILSNGSYGYKQIENNSEAKSVIYLKNKTEKVELDDAQFSQLLKLIKTVQNFTSIEKSLSNMSDIIQEIKSSELSVYSKILKKIEQTQLQIPSEKLLINISRQLEAANVSRGQFYIKFLNAIKRKEGTPDVKFMASISYKLEKMKESYEKLYTKFYETIRNKNNSFESLFEAENVDFSEILKSDNESSNNPFFQHLKAVGRDDEEDREHINNVTSKLNFLILFSVFCYAILFSLVLYVIGEKKLLSKLRSLKKREELCDEMSTLAN